MKKWYSLKIALLDAVDSLCMNLVDRIYKSRKKALARWQKLGGAA